MKWFEGGIPGAIQAAKQNNSVFIVYVAGEDDKSTEMESCLNSPEITEMCETNRCVAIKIMGNSNDCKFFSQIYPVVVIPSTFFIGNTGVPLEVIGEVISPEDFLAKVKNAIELQKQASGPPNQSQAPAAEPVQQAQAVSSPVATPPNPAQEEDAEMAEAAASPGASAGSGDDEVPEKKAKSSEDLETRVERAKQKVEQKRIEKQQNEAEQDRQRELDRRAMGQGVQKLRQQQKEMEVIEAKKELKKDREDDKLARQRVKEQIARDRAERAAKFGKEKEERDQAREEARKRKLLEEQAAHQAEQARLSETARLQFRQPDGSSITRQFPATAKFEEVYAFISQEMGSSVTLSTTFPRRTFTLADHSSTLQDLQLVPSAAILVMPRGMSTSGVRGSSGLSVTSITSLVLAPFVFIWNMIASLLGLSGSPSSSRPAQSRTASNNQPTSASGGDRNRGSATNRSPAAGSTSRQEGSVHRFRNTQDDQDPDDTSTWNGNSTQQM